MDRGGHPHVSDTRLWQHACEAFMGGVFHSIGSRVSALSGIGSMARMGQHLDGSLLALLEDEIEHLTDALEASRILPRVPADLVGPARLASLLPRALSLLELNLDARRLDFVYEGPDEGAAVEMDGTTAVHSLAALLMCLGWSAAIGPETVLAVRLATGDGDVTVRAEISAGEAAAGGAESGARENTAPPEDVIAEGIAAIRSGVEAWGGTLDIDSDVRPRRFELRMPRLGT